MIRVIIERRLAEGKEQEYQQTMRKLKQKASHFPGYLSGEILVEQEEPRHWVILSNWDTLEHWQAWEASDARKETLNAISPMLDGDEIIKVYRLALQPV